MSKKNLLMIFLIIVGVDFVSKMLALNLLPENNDVNIIGDKVSFYLTYNMGSTGGQLDALFSQESNKNINVLVSSMNGILFMLYILFIYKKSINKLYKWLMGIGLFVILALISEIMIPMLNAFTISNWLTAFIGKIAGISIYLPILFISKNRFIRLFATIIISAGFGNLISHLYYPYRVVDFINIQGSYELLRIGIFNIADILIDVGQVGLIITLVIVLINQIKLPYNTKKTESKK